MKMTNETYDRLKWVALVAIPAAEVFWLTIGKVWGFPYLTEIGATVGAAGVFLGSLLGLSSKAYYADDDSVEVKANPQELIYEDDYEKGDDEDVAD